MRNERNRHARPGEEIQLYTGMRTKHCELICRATCMAVTPVQIDFKRVTIRVEGRGLIAGLDKLDIFAMRDGFENWADMRAFWMDEHGRTRGPNGEPAPPLTSWSGVLIEWDAATIRENTKSKKAPRD